MTTSIKSTEEESQLLEGLMFHSYIDLYTGPYHDKDIHRQLGPPQKMLYWRNGPLGRSVGILCVRVGVCSFVLSFYPPICTHTTIHTGAITHNHTFTCIHSNTEPSEGLICLKIEQVFFFKKKTT